MDFEGAILLDSHIDDTTDIDSSQWPRDEDNSNDDNPIADLAYSVKFISRKKRSEFKMARWYNADNRRFKNIDDLKAMIHDDFTELPLDGDIGYVEPGHGAKGKQRWLNSSEDLAEMYKVFKNKKECMLWYCPKKKLPTKRQFTPDPCENPTEDHSKRKTLTKYQQHDLVMEEIDGIEKKLKEKQKDYFTSEQLRTWAHLIHMGKHTSYDEPPNKPFFKSANKTISRSDSQADSISPAKKLHIRSTCIQQLSDWHALYEKGAITHEQYKEFQMSIMKDMKGTN